MKKNVLQSAGFFIFILIICSLMSCKKNPTEAASLPVMYRTLNLIGSIDYRADAPVSSFSSITADDAGNIYILGGKYVTVPIPAYQDEIMRYAYPGYARTDWLGNTSGGVTFAANMLSVNPAGNLYFNDINNDKVIVFDNALNNTGSFGSHGNDNGKFYVPSGIAIDKSGYIYVSDSGRIQRFDGSSNYVSQFGYSGNPRNLNVWAIAVDSGNNLYASDQANEKLIRFNRVTGEFICQWEYRTGAEKRLWYPSSVAVDKNGDVYVVNQNLAEIEKFDPDGNFLEGFGSCAIGAKYIKNPFSIAIAGGKLYVMDDKILVFDLGLD